MEAFRIKALIYLGDTVLEPQEGGGASLSVEDFDSSCEVNLTRLELVAMRDWLIAYTG